MIQKFLTTLKARMQSGSHLFGIPSKWKIIFSAAAFLCFFGLGMAYYIWYNVAYGDNGESTVAVQATNTVHTFDQKKLQAMIADLNLREQAVFGGSTEKSATTTP